MAPMTNVVESSSLSNLDRSEPLRRLFGFAPNRSMTATRRCLYRRTFSPHSRQAGSRVTSACRDDNASRNIPQHQ